MRSKPSCHDLCCIFWLSIWSTTWYILRSTFLPLHFTIISLSSNHQLNYFAFFDPKSEKVIMSRPELTWCLMQFWLSPSFNLMWNITFWRPISSPASSLHFQSFKPTRFLRNLNLLFLFILNIQVVISMGLMNNLDGTFKVQWTLGYHLNWVMISGTCRLQQKSDIIRHICDDLKLCDIRSNTFGLEDWFLWLHGTILYFLAKQSTFSSYFRGSKLVVVRTMSMPKVWQ